MRVAIPADYSRRSSDIVYLEEPLAEPRKNPTA